eukprot:6204243-Pleurochrysis_carterae.AAC.3
MRRVAASLQHAGFLVLLLGKAAMLLQLAAFKSWPDRGSIIGHATPATRKYERALAEAVGAAVVKAVSVVMLPRIRKPAKLRRKVITAATINFQRSSDDDAAKCCGHTSLAAHIAYFTFGSAAMLDFLYT